MATWASRRPRSRAGPLPLPPDQPGPGCAGTRSVDLPARVPAQSPASATLATGSLAPRSWPGRGPVSGLPGRGPAGDGRRAAKLGQGQPGACQQGDQQGEGGRHHRAQEEGEHPLAHPQAARGQEAQEAHRPGNREDPRQGRQGRGGDRVDGAGQEIQAAAVEQPGGAVARERLEQVAAAEVRRRSGGPGAAERPGDRAPQEPRHRVAGQQRDRGQGQEADRPPRPPPRRGARSRRPGGPR
jgi:hypothetical protein